MNEISIKKDRHFREFCSGVATRYEEKGKWSSEELDIKAYLESLGFVERRTYWHNFRLQNPEQTGYYTLDFYLPTLNLIVENDGKIFHGQMGNTDLKDKVRDNWLRFLGIKTIRIHKIEELKEVFCERADCRT